MRRHDTRRSIGSRPTARAWDLLTRDRRATARHARSTSAHPQNVAPATLPVVPFVVPRPVALAPSQSLPDRALPFLARYVRLRPLHFGALAALIVVAALSAVGVQYGMKLIVDAMANGERDGSAVWRALAFFITLIAVESIAWRGAGWLSCVTVVATGVDVRLDLFRHLSGHSLAYFGKHLAGSLGNRLTSTTGATAAVMLTFVWKILPPCIDFVGAVVVIATIDVPMSLALIGFVAVVAAFMTFVGIRARPLQRDFAEEAARVGGELVDVVVNIRAVQAFAAREREWRRLRDAFRVEAAAQRRSWLFLEKARIVHDLMLWTMAGGMLIWAVASWRSGHAEAGSVVLVSALTFRILHGSRDLALSLVDASQQFGLVEETLRIVASPHQVADRPDAVAFVAPRGDVRFERVTFGYGDEPPLFVDLDLHIPAGQRIGIVGPSGAGKSTLLDLIQRVADVRSGRVAIDGQPIDTMRQETLRERIAVVPQDSVLFHRTLMENLRYGRPDATDAAVKTAACDALCDGFIATMPDGYDTLVGERGVRLSGGQRQRIGIARAFLKDAPILILDEATSALDSRSEDEIQRALLRLMRGRTVIAVAHRLSTVSSFDRVIVMVDGRIVEDAAPDQLRRSNGVYAQMWQLQAEGFDAS